MNMQTRPQRIGWMTVVLALTVASSLLAFALTGWPVHGVDDAQIALAYAQNIATGEGFVFNQGGERVEGSSSLLWTLVGAAAALTPFPERTLTVVGWLLTGGAVYTTVLFLLTTLPARGDGSRARRFWYAAFAITWCLTSAAFVVWNTVSLLDTALWCFVLTAGTLLFSRAAVEHGGRRSTIALCIVTSVALVTRPEAMAFAALWIVALGATTFLATGSLRMGIQRALPPAIAYGLTLAALFTLRLVYFGYPLPNTYYAKMSSDIAYNFWMGARYGGKLLLEYPILILWSAISVVSIHACVKMGLRRSQPGVVDKAAPEVAWLVVSVVALAALVQPVLTGGDHFVLLRFYQSAWPLMIVPPLLWMNDWLTRARESGGRQRYGHLILLAATAAVALSSGQTWRSLGDPAGIRVEFGEANAGLARGTLLNEMFESATLPSLGDVVVGGVARAYKGQVLDLMGLNSVAMGHSPGNRYGIKNHAAFNAEVFFRLAPDLVLPKAVPMLPGGEAAVRATQVNSVLDTAFDHRVLHGTLVTKRFRDLYLGVMLVQRSPDTTRAIRTWLRRDRIGVVESARINVIPFAGQEL